MIYGIETFDSTYDELLPLIQEHHEEIDEYKEKLYVNIDKGFYQAIEGSGHLLIFTARTDDGKLVGYASFIIQRNPHYQHTVFGINDAIFVKKEYRNTKAGVELVRRAEEVLKNKIGVEFITYHAKVKHSLTRFFKKLGYRMHEHSYMKEV